MRILIADDIEVNRYYLETLFASRGYRTSSACNGIEALELLRQHSFDLIVSDILMPQKDGFQLCREMKENEQWRHIPFIFYTATYTDKKDEQLGLSIGAARFIIKPQEPDVLLAQIEEVLNECRRNPQPGAAPAPDREVFLQTHNERLIEKLEHKIQQLESSNKALEEALAAQKQHEAENRLEEKFRQAQKMELIGTLAGGIAHDFNNMLSVIIPYAELARSESADHSPFAEYLDEILKASSRAKDLVSQILTFCRKAKSTRRSVLLQPVVDEVAKMLRSAIPSTIDILVQCDPGISPVVADTVRMHQVLMNLCTNAAHAMRDKPGQMKIVLREVLVESRERPPDVKPGSYVELCVEDTGHGMDSETMKRIFEPFYTTKAPGEGTGMGLAVVHGIVREHEGCIYAESEPGKGSSFHVLLPVCNQQPTPAGIESKSIEKGNGETILFVDDEHQLTLMARNILKRLNYQVQTYENPLDAISEFSRNSGSYALIFTDLTMPKMTGIDLAIQARAIRCDIPVILFYRYKCAISQESADKLGSYEMLPKPFSPAAMARVIKKALNREKTGG